MGSERLEARWRLEYERAHGFTPWIRSRESWQLEQLARHFPDLEAVELCIAAWHELDDPFCRASGWSVGAFCSRFQALYIALLERRRVAQRQRQREELERADQALAPIIGRIGKGGRRGPQRAQNARN